MNPAGSRLKHALWRIPRFILHVLWRMGIRVSPFLVSSNEFKSTGLDTHTFETGFEGLDRIEEILLVEPGSDREEIYRWFEEGRLCFGLRDEGRLIAKMWCDLETFHFPPAYRQLDKVEVYFYAACVLEKYRGRNIALLMRSACCEALSTMGYKRYLSYTDYFNYPARRFKEKRGDRDESLQVHVKLFDRWSRTWTLKYYR
jgi:GNAT superfamily N-acetyltransferase